MPRPCGLEFRTTGSHPVFNYFQPGDVPANTGIADAAQQHLSYDRIIERLEKLEKRLELTS